LNSRICAPTIKNCKRRVTVRWLTVVKRWKMGVYSGKKCGWLKTVWRTTISVVRLRICAEVNVEMTIWIMRLSICVEFGKICMR
jgi:hypothetical protein